LNARSAKLSKPRSSHTNRLGGARTAAAVLCGFGRTAKFVAPSLPALQPSPRRKSPAELARSARACCQCARLRRATSSAAAEGR
jgi:hypothetical protein